MSGKTPESGGQGGSCPPVPASMRVVFCTFPSAQEAREVGGEIIGKMLAACVNIVPGVESIYHWDGQVRKDSEVLAIFKTSAEIYPKFQRELLRLHSYDVPEIISLIPEEVIPDYLAWVIQQCDGTSRTVPHNNGKTSDG